MSERKVYTDADYPGPWHIDADPRDHDAFQKALEDRNARIDAWVERANKREAQEEAARQQKPVVEELERIANGQLEEQIAVMAIIALVAVFVVAALLMFCK